MSIAALPSTMSAMQGVRTPEASEGSGPDHDGDADDKGVPSVSGVTADLPVGMGAAVNIRA